MSSTLQAQFPWISTPLIINAPMSGFTTAALATAVTLSGGIGMIGAVDMKEGTDQLDRARTMLSANATPDQKNSTLPLGFGLLLFLSKLEEVLPIISEYRPAIVWLFSAKDIADYADWASQIRTASPQSKVWVQVGSVSAAVSVARSCASNLGALVIQGSDAGGHGFEHGASILSLLPEATDVLHSNGFGAIPLLAAGGIVDGRGVAAALALGAAGVVMGTKFLVAAETDLHPKYREAVLQARDGALSTIRARVFDELKGESIWPRLYDGRALATESYRDHKEGVDMEKIRELYSEAAVKEDKGYGGRAAVWAGAGVGLVNEIKGAAEIVEEVRSGARDVIENLKA